MSNTLVLTFLTLSFFACASRPTPPAAPANTRVAPAPAVCVGTELSSNLLIQVDSRSLGMQPEQKTSIAIDGNGSWRYTSTSDGRIVKQAQGCLEASDLAALKTALAAATWTTTQAKIRCMAIATSSTTYSYQGKPMLTSEMCDGQILDESTQKALDVTNQIVAKVIPPS